MGPYRIVVYIGAEVFTGGAHSGGGDLALVLEFANHLGQTGEEDGLLVLREFLD